MEDWCPSCKTSVSMARDMYGKRYCVCGYMIDFSYGFGIGHYSLFDKRTKTPTGAP